MQNEVHSRLRFVRRGLVATANTGNNDNESQFFFTLGTTPELQNKHTIFGKVGGNTLFNMVWFDLPISYLWFLNILKYSKYSDLDTLWTVLVVRYTVCGRISINYY